MKRIDISCYGALRDLSTNGVIRVEAEFPCTAATLKKIAMEQFPATGASVIYNSAVSQGNRILKNSDLINPEEELSLLPPVNGG